MIGAGERELLVQAIEQQLGHSLSSQVREAFLRMPRHLFVEQVKQKINWGQYDTQPPTIMYLPDVKTKLQNPAYGLLLQSFLPEMRKRYRSKDDQVHLYLIAQESAILVEDDRLLIFGDAGIGQMLQQSFDLYHQLGQPRITEYRVTLQERRAVIRVADQRFDLPYPHEQAVY